MLDRIATTCILRPEDVPPSHEQMEVLGAFNPGVIATENEVVLLVRTAERPREMRSGYTPLPRWDVETGLAVDWFADDRIEFLDPRVVRIKATGHVRLSFMSHLVVVRSRDGRTVSSIDPVRFMPELFYETYGVEDPRITRLDDRYYFTYVAVSPHGAATALASTPDFKTFTRHGIIFPSENKDVLLFPEKIGGRYAALHRPNPQTHFSAPEMWTAFSPDLSVWGDHGILHGGVGEWETGRIGGGAPPFRVDDGWLEIYHGNNKKPGDPTVGVYAAGALLLDSDAPQRIRKHSNEPVMVPEADFEREGFVPNVVFPTGIVERDDILFVYYGAADAATGVAEIRKRDILTSLV